MMATRDGFPTLSQAYSGWSRTDILDTIAGLALMQEAVNQGKSLTTADQEKLLNIGGLPRPQSKEMQSGSYSRYAFNYDRNEFDKRDFKAMKDFLGKLQADFGELDLFGEPGRPGQGLIGSSALEDVAQSVMESDKSQRQAFAKILPIISALWGDASDNGLLSKEALDRFQAAVFRA